MNTYQLCMVDEYGQNSIINSSSDLSIMIKEGKKIVEDINVNNALTSDEKRRNWEAFFVEFDDENIIYASRDNKGIPSVYLIGHDPDFCALNEIENIPRFYLGILDGEPWYAEDEKRNEINNIQHKDLINKTCYFIKKV